MVSVQFSDFQPGASTICAADDGIGGFENVSPGIVPEVADRIGLVERERVGPSDDLMSDGRSLALKQA
jgi:hypothetical protein